MAKLKRPDLRVVLGRGGSGKSYLVQHWLASERRPVLIFDAAGEVEYAAGAMLAETPRQLLDLVAANFTRARIVYRQPLGARDGFELFNRIAWAAENLTVVWEEVDSWFRGRDTEPVAFAMVNQGRHRGLRVIATARRPARVPRDLTANASRIVAFSTTEPRDLKYLADYMGAAAAGQVAALRHDLYEAVDWSEAGSAVKKSPFR